MRKKELSLFKTKMKIYHTNCSEMSFKFTGSFSEIKEEVLKMIEIVKSEYKSETTNNCGLIQNFLYIPLNIYFISHLYL